MLALVVSGLFLASPPALPSDAGPSSDSVGQPIVAAEPEPVEPFVIAPAPVEGPAEAEAPVVVDAGASAPQVVNNQVVIITTPPVPPGFKPLAPAPMVQAVPAPPWSGAGRFVGGAFMLVAGTGLLTAATFEFSDSRDTTKPLISQVPAGVSMVIAGSVMIGTAARDQRRLGEWEAATRRDAPPTGNGLIIAGVSTSALGAMAAVATAIASDMDLDAPRSIPAGWATAGVALGAGTAMLIAGIVRRSRYGAWKDRLVGTPMIIPVRSGAAVGLHTQF